MGRNEEGFMFHLFCGLFYIVAAYGLFSVIWTWTYGEANEVYNEAYIICAYDVERTSFEINGTKYELQPTQFNGLDTWKRNEECWRFANEQSLAVMVPPFGWIWKNM